MTSLSPEAEIRALHHELVESWNGRDAQGMAGLFTAGGSKVGFDGSTVEGREAIAAHLGDVFGSHETATYVGKVRSVRPLADDVALLQAVVGMVPPGQRDINPDVNAVQSLVAVRQDGEWRVALFHNTPAAFHGRPEVSEKLTQELRDVLQSRR